MERIKSKKKQVSNPNNFAHPDDYSRAQREISGDHVSLQEQGDMPQTRTVASPRGQTKPVADPAQRPQYHLDGYGAPVRVFVLGQRDKVFVYYREKEKDGGGQVRVYYAGAVLLGSVTITPLLVTSHFHHNLGQLQHRRHQTIEDVHDELRKLLQQEL